MIRSKIRQQLPIRNDYWEYNALGKDRVAEIEYLYIKGRSIFWRIDALWNLWRKRFRDGPNESIVSSIRHNYKFLSLDLEDSDARMIELNIWDAILQLKAEGSIGSIVVLMDQLPTEDLKRALQRLGYDNSSINVIESFDVSYLQKTCGILLTYVFHNSQFEWWYKTLWLVAVVEIRAVFLNGSIIIDLYMGPMDSSLLIKDSNNHTSDIEEFRILLYHFYFQTDTITKSRETEERESWLQNRKYSHGSLEPSHH